MYCMLSILQLCPILISSSYDIVVYEAIICLMGMSGFCMYISSIDKNLVIVLLVLKKQLLDALQL